MDANGGQFYMLAGAEDFSALDSPPLVHHSQERGTWSLSSTSPPPVLAEDVALAASLVERAPRALDEFGSVARVVTPTEGAEESEESQYQVVVQHEDVADTAILSSAEEVTDVAMGPDGVISLAVGGEVWLRDARTLGDTREDWQRLTAELLQTDAAPDVVAWRVAPRPDGGAWVLDRENGQLALWSGKPLRSRPKAQASPGTFRPEPEDPKTLDFRVVGQAGRFGDELPVGIACSPAGKVVVLCWHSDAEEAARLHLFDLQGVWEASLQLTGVLRPVSVQWVKEDRVALVATNGAELYPEAIVYEAALYAEGVETTPVGERYPLRRALAEPLVHAAPGRGSYMSETGPRLLSPLSLPRRGPSGQVRGTVLDGGAAGTCWHRLYAEALLPPGCGIRVELSASDVEEDEELMFFPHDFGSVPQSAPGSELAGMTPVPRATWSSEPSEIPMNEGLLRCAPVFDRAGLFGVLIQRSGLTTRRLCGRYLHVRLTFHGTGGLTPELAALRAYGPRFSYVRQYLAELYHEDPLLEGKAEPGAATPADFLERFMALFEGVLTPLEDRVSEAWCYTNPRTAPKEALDWLASWVGLEFSAGLPESVRRKLLYFAPQMARERGTRRGLERVLEIVTEGGVTRGDVLVIEDFRLRRTWATVLGADLAEEADPLLGGLVVNANSVVGETLVLGDEHHREFLALFGQQHSSAGAGDGVIAPSMDDEAVEEFFDNSAHRATVLVFDGVDDTTMANLRHVVDRERPGYVHVEVKRASRSFIVAVTALVGVDTRLGVEPEPLTVRLGRSRLGAGDRLQRPAALHPDVQGDGA